MALWAPLHDSQYRRKIPCSIEKIPIFGWQGIGRKLLNLLGDRLSKRAKEAGIVRNLQEIPC
jgi:hypothetical protein